FCSRFTHVAFYLNAVEMLVKIPFSVVPTLPTAATITIEMPPAIRAYSIAVAAASSAKKAWNFLIMAAVSVIYSDSLSVRKNGLGRIAESDSDVRHDLLRLSYRSRTHGTSRAGPRRVERGASGAPGQCDCLVERRLELRGSRHSFADRRRYRAIVA